jgi:hypothetical protein
VDEARFWLSHLPRLAALFVGRDLLVGSGDQVIDHLRYCDELGEPLAIERVVVHEPDLAANLRYCLALSKLGFSTEPAPLGHPQDSRYVEALRPVLTARARRFARRLPGL